MRTRLMAIMLVCVVHGDLRAQDISLWVRLSRNRVLTDCRFHEISSDTLIVFSGNRREAIPIEQVCQIRGVKNSAILKGALIGSGCGVVAGIVLGLAVNTSDKSGPSTSATSLAFAVLGGIIGGSMSALEKPEDLVSLENMPREEKIKLIQDVVRRASQELP
jgi:hypothetical protein